jgi:hypothetical protein
MINGYEVITAKRVADLQDRVRERISSGWQPLGGVALLHDEESGDDIPHMVFAQALITTQ